MQSNQKRDLTMSRQLLTRGCKNTKDRLIERAGGHQIVPMDLQMETEYKPLEGVHTR